MNHLALLPSMRFTNVDLPMLGRPNTIIRISEEVFLPVVFPTRLFLHRAQGFVRPVHHVAKPPTVLRRDRNHLIKARSAGS